MTSPTKWIRCAQHRICISSGYISSFMLLNDLILYEAESDMNATTLSYDIPYSNNVLVNSLVIIILFEASTSTVSTKYGLRSTVNMILTIEREQASGVSSIDTHMPLLLNNCLSF